MPSRPRQPATRSRYRRWPALALLGCALWYAGAATAQEVPEPTVHWAYASYFGTGWYKISDQQSAFIANFAPLLTTGKTRWFGGRDGKAVYSIRVPITLGLTQLDFEDVLRRIGVDRIFSPERDLARRLAQRIDTPAAAK